MKDLLNEINKELFESTELKSTKVVFPGSEYESIPFSPDHFHQISDLNAGIVNEEVMAENLEETKIAFIDGGNSVILETPSVCVQIIRLYFNIYKNTKKINSGKYEFFTLSKSKYIHGRMLFQTKIFSAGNSLIPNETDLQFDPGDETLTQGKSFAEISQVGGYARRFGELMLALDLCKILDSGDVVVLDGTLQSKITGEKKYLDALYSGAKEKDIVVSALAKTSRLFTDSGDDAVAAVSKLSSQDSWFYYPIAKIKSEDHRAEMYFVKLCKSSPYCFRVETSLGVSKGKISSVFALLSMQSYDGVFMGYPYGLIDADQNARISNEEKNYLRTVFGNSSLEKTLDSHSVLDKISF